MPSAWLRRLATAPLPGAVTAAAYLQRLAPRGRWGELDVAGERLRVDFGRSKYWPLLTGTYEPGVTAAFRRLLRPGDGVLDVGANWGYFSLLAAKLVGDRGYVLALEPNPVAFPELRRHLSALPQAVAVNAAAGATEGEAFLAVPRWRADTASHLSSTGVRVPVRPLDALWPSDRSCRLIKIDAEGFELGVLQGAESLLRDSGVAAVAVEVGEFTRRAGDTAGRILGWLQDRGFGCLYVEQGARLAPLEKASWESVNSNVIAARQPLDTNASSLRSGMES